MVAHARNPSPGEAAGFADLVNSRSMKVLMSLKKSWGGEPWVLRNHPRLFLMYAKSVWTDTDRYTQFVLAYFSCVLNLQD